MDAEPTTRGHGGGGKGSKASGEICRTFASTGQCRFGNKCRFSHNVPGTQGGFAGGGKGSKDRAPCRDFAQHGRCKFGRNCRFSHAAPGSQASAFGDAPMDASAYDEQMASTPSTFSGGSSGGGNAFGSSAIFGQPARPQAASIFGAGEAGWGSAPPTKATASGFGSGGATSLGGGGAFGGGASGGFGASAGSAFGCGAVGSSGFNGGGGAFGGTGAASKWTQPNISRNTGGTSTFASATSPSHAAVTGFGALTSGSRGKASPGAFGSFGGAQSPRRNEASARGKCGGAAVVDETSTITDAASVGEEQLKLWRLSKEQFEAFNAASFQFGGIPEIPPPEIVA
eukprot:scaffold67919_cov32-Tisochrysis_lutea.AAC.3